MTNSQFRFSPLVAACRAAPWRLCVKTLSAKAPRNHLLKMPAVDFMPVVLRVLREGARRPFNYWLLVRL
jgi:hypothetical protein